MILTVKEPTKCCLHQNFPTDLTMESLFSIIPSTILGTQCSLEYISKYVDLERALFSYSVACYLYMKVKVTQSCPTLCDPMDYTVHGILQARILEWVAIPFSMEKKGMFLN